MRTLWHFLAKTPSGRFLVFGALLGGALALLPWLRRRVELPTLEAAQGPHQAEESQVVQTVQRPLTLFRPPRDSGREVIRTQAQVAASPPVVATTTSQPPPPLPPMSLLADTTAGKPPIRKLGPVYAPYGRLIPCETVITVDSASIRTPIVGLVTEDIHHAGNLVIPAGTEVHGTAQTDRSRERISSGTGWTLVWQTGEELRLRAMALDREFDNTTNQVGWGITDGSAGLRGRLIRSDDLAEIRLFAATFLSGAAAALTEKESTLLGAIDSRSLNNAPLKGAEEILRVYAQRIHESIERDGFYVRVPSGKPFYLYVLQSIDRAEAVPGGGLAGLAASDEPATP